MRIIHMLNVADVFFMGMGLAAALLMIVVGTHGDEPKSDRSGMAPSRVRRQTRI
jgi:hypothetical protein